MRAGLHEDDEGAEVLFGELQGRLSRVEVLSFNKHRTTNFKRRHREVSGVCRALVPPLHMEHLFMEEVVEGVEID